jgi:uncharacterized protein (TIGR00299 family) protein
MKNKLYLECYSGISGDMVIAALLDLGVDEAVLKKGLDSLSAKGFQTKISRVKKAGLDVCDFAVILDKEHENHDHDMEYLHGKKTYYDEHKHGEHEDEEYYHGEHYHGEHQKEEHQHEEHHHEEHHHEEHHHGMHNHGDYNHEEYFHEENHQKEQHSHSHEHRGLPEILDIIEHAEISEHAKYLAGQIFEILAHAEAKAHGTTLEEVHFHEVGAVDSIVDIIAVSVCLDYLSIDEVIIPILYEGTGFVRCQHGVLPVPVPAVLNIVQKHKLKLRITNTEGEFVTPTGAAIAAAIKTSDQLPEQFIVQKIGIGTGKRNYERPSLLRAMLIQEETYENDFIYKLETNIDDCSGEALGYVMERLMEAGALDVHYIPVFMKKNRPAYQLNVLCKKEELEKLDQLIYEETTTIGIRRQRMERSVLKRETQQISTSLGDVRVKVCELPSGKRCYVEYSSVIELCKKYKMSYQDVYQLIMKECNIS